MRINGFMSHLSCDSNTRQQCYKNLTKYRKMNPDAKSVNSISSVIHQYDKKFYN